jgi:hypothetical protein
MASLSRPPLQNFLQASMDFISIRLEIYVEKAAN